MNAPPVRETTGIGLALRASLGRALCAVFAAIMAAVAFTTPVTADTIIDSPPQTTVHEFIGNFGENGAATWGQTFTVPANDTQLDRFTFHLQDQAGSGPARVNFRAYVMKWDSLNRRAVGPVLFSSGALQSIFTGSGVSAPFTIDTGQLVLLAGEQYVAFFSASELLDTIRDSALLRYNSTGPYPGGSMVYIENGSNFGLLTTKPWWVDTGDLVFQMHFVAPTVATPTVSSSKANLLRGEPATFTAHILPTGAQGTITFSDGVAPICVDVPLVSGTATCVQSFSTGGVHSITVKYNGSADYPPATSPSINITVTDQVQRATEVISRFLSLRNDRLLTNEPNGQRQIDRLMRIDSAGGAISPRLTTGRTSSAGSGGFYSSFDDARFGVGNSGTPETLASRVDSQNSHLAMASYPTFASLQGSAKSEEGISGSFSTSLQELLQYGERLDPMKRAGFEAKDASLASPSVDVWLQGSYSSLDDDHRAHSEGHFGVVYLGADYVVRPWLLIGALVQYDDMEQFSTTTNFEVDGTGWMAGPYATARLTQSLFWQGRAAWGRSRNSVSPFSTYTDVFESTRLIVTSSFNGHWTSGAWRYRPSASFNYIEDTSDAYFDSTGMFVPAVPATRGQIKLEPEVVYVHTFRDGTVSEPRLAGALIWSFDSSNAGPSLGGAFVGGEKVRGKMEAGIGIRFPNGVSIDVSGSYDGIGASSYNATSVDLGARIPIN